MKLKIISAGAGSGKTYRLTQEMVRLLKEGVRPNGIIATTFTKKAAAELQERVRVKLLEEGMVAEANELTNALIGTVHGLGVKLLQRFAFEAGVSPEVEIMPEEDQQLTFNNSLATVLTQERVEQMERLSERLGYSDNKQSIWRKTVKDIIDIARSNDFGPEALRDSMERSISSFQEFMGDRSETSAEQWNQRLDEVMAETMTRLQNNEDSTGVTQKVIDAIKDLRNTLRFKKRLDWGAWAKLGKLKPGAKSREDAAELIELAKNHDTHPAFQQDIADFIQAIFETVIAALEEYDHYKKQRGFIDFIDMEILVKKLLDHPDVRQVLSEEIDLLMVDEFQDTSPIQLETFLKLVDIADHAIWVGDPKQSIYGFRGADPALMQAIIEKNGGIRDEDIQEHSWRSREDIVYLTNALFTKAFDQLPARQIALKPKRKKLADADSQNEENEPLDIGDAILHWHCELDAEKGKTNKEWFARCIADNVSRMLERGPKILPKGEPEYRPIRPGDIAVLCRSNNECEAMATALHQQGIRAALARTGLLNTAEAKLVLACLKYILNRADSLSAAEILLLAGQIPIEKIVDDRLEFLDKLERVEELENWAQDQPQLRQLDRLRSEVEELSSAEILNLVLEDMDLRRIIARWGRQTQRMANIDAIRNLALTYEEACNRLHTAASLGGFLLWLAEQENNQDDKQGSGEGPDAVNVLTYHSSKGLEWPVVILNSLEASVRDSLFGLAIVQEQKEIDLNNIMAGRWLRCWINPYGKQFRGTPLYERLQESEAQSIKRLEVLQEEARLLYVGITRARDYLVFPTRDTSPAWLNRVYHQGEDNPTIESSTNETPWEWQGQIIYTDLEERFFPKDFTYAPPPAEDIVYQEARAGSQPHQSLLIDPDTELADEVRLKTGKPINYGPPPDVGKDLLYPVNRAIKIMLSADQKTYPDEDRLKIAAGILKRLEITEDLQPHHLVRQSNEFEEQIEQLWSPTQVYRKYPLEWQQGQRIFKTVADLVLDSTGGLILIQHSSFAGAPKHFSKKAKELAPWFYLTRKALAAQFQRPIRASLIHFVLSATLLEIHPELKRNTGADLFSANEITVKEK